MSDEKKHSHPPEQPCPTCGFNRHVLIAKPTVSSAAKKATPKKQTGENVDGLDPAPTADSKKARKRKAEESVEVGMDPIQQADLCKQAEAKPLTPKAITEFQTALVARAFIRKKDSDLFARTLVNQLGFHGIQQASLSKLLSIAAPSNKKMTSKIAERLLKLLGDPAAKQKKKKKKAPVY